MLIGPEGLLAISTATTLLTQVAKRVIPGDNDQFGVAFNGAIALICTLAWVFSQDAIPGRIDLFNILALWASIWGGSVGIYKTARMATATSAGEAA